MSLIRWHRFRHRPPRHEIPCPASISRSLLPRAGHHNRCFIVGHRRHSQCPHSRRLHSWCLRSSRHSFNHSSFHSSMPRCFNTCQHHLQRLRLRRQCTCSRVLPKLVPQGRTSLPLPPLLQQPWLRWVLSKLRGPPQRQEWVVVTVRQTNWSRLARRLAKRAKASVMTRSRRRSDGDFGTKALRCVLLLRGVLRVVQAARACLPLKRSLHRRLATCSKSRC